MTMNPLPPQAYTKDTLTKAYSWLQHQNASIKELATTPDVLVSLFLKAQRNGDESLDTPSIQNFKNELKSLAGMMGELDGKSSAVAETPAPAPQAAPTAAPAYHAQHARTTHHQQAPVQQTQSVVVSPSATASIFNQLDSRSQVMINEVREQLNLSSDIEVLRLLISLGYHKAKSLYS